MRDGYGRDINYLRLSVTDLCNLRCVYCMPAGGVEKRRHEDVLTVEELEEIAQSAGRCGIRKIRLTGGEPLVRRGIVDICARTAAAPGVEEVCMTTNGLLLPKMAAELRRAGLRRVNISLDTLSPERYRELTRVGNIEDAVAGLRAALEGSLKRLRTDRIDLYYIHRIPEGAEMEEIASWFGRLIKEGKILGWGLPEADAEQIRRAHGRAGQAQGLRRPHRR